MSQHILFICTGNTCRSPLAEGLARDWLRQHGLDSTWTVGSAGVFAVDGSEPSPEVAALLASRGISEVGQSASLTSEMLQGASVVFAMTAAHAEAAQRILGDAPGPPIQTLDPAGDVPDPIGHGFGVYADLADRLDAVLDQVLKEVTHANNDLG
ncbi:MAG: low molecular weight protein arginine phosphatase [Planctomycetota bacterium]|nr:low molecular weight protein arginine phosphatase [Planctomycetota bacterium]